VATSTSWTSTASAASEGGAAPENIRCGEKEHVAASGWTPRSVPRVEIRDNILLNIIVVVVVLSFVSVCRTKDGKQQIRGERS
jgi:hypothetical protein